MIKRLRLSLSSIILLCIIVPVLIEMFFFFRILQTVDQLEKAWEDEARAVDALVLVDGIQTDCMSGAAALGMFKTLGDKHFLAEAQLAFGSMQDDARQLRELAASTKDEHAAIRAFIRAMDDIEHTVMNTGGFMSDSSFSVGSVNLIGTLHSCVTRIKVTANKTVEEQTVYRKQSHARLKQESESLRLTLQAATITNAILAALMAVGVTVMIGRKLRILQENTVKIAIGQPLNPVLKGDDELARLDGVIHNLAEELVLTRQKERAILDNTAEIICTLDEALRVADITPAIEKRLGYTPDEFRGSLFQSYVHPDDRGMAHEDLMHCKNLREEISFEVRMRDKDETYRSMEVTAQWSEKDKTIFCIARDVTARKEAERLKQEVIAMVSHDLRAPLTSLGITLEMILEGIAGTINEQGTKMVTVARQSVVSLITMINDLLDMERFEATGIQLRYEKFDVLPMIEQAVAVMEPESTSKKLKVTVSCDEFSIDADNERLNRVVTNLLGNAIKFSPADSALFVDCHNESDGAGGMQMRFEIRDEGPGIEEDKLSLVFEKFRQAGTRSAGEKAGSGLGLAICKSIIEAHGGRIGVRSTLGKGSTFWFIVPLSPAPLVKAAPGR